jgi:lysozyme
MEDKVSNVSVMEQGIRRAKELRAQDYYKMISLNEGVKPKVYKDSKGHRTIGVGFNLEDAGNRNILKKEGIDINEIFKGKELDDDEIKTLYNYSLTQAFNDAQKFDKGFAKRPEKVKKAIVDMSFNLGLTRLNKFKKMREGLEVDDYSKAADEMVDSEWYKQIKSRGPRTVDLMRSSAKDRLSKLQSEINNRD